MKNLGKWVAYLAVVFPGFVVIWSTSSRALGGWVIPLLFLWAMAASKFVSWVFSSRKNP
jgi:hypothetical protein